MSIQYKNVGINLNSTNAISVLTAPTSGRCLIKQIQLHNSHSGNVNVTTSVTNTVGTFKIDLSTVGTNATKEVITKTLVLEEGNILKLTADVADKIEGIVSYALIDRSLQNG